MANYQIAKPIIDGLVHFKDCEKKAADCETCLKFAVQIGGILSEVSEVAELIRRLSQLSMAANGQKPPVPVA